MSKKKFFVPLLIVSFLIPQITFASWWNPLSWGWFKKKEAAPLSIQVVPASRDNTSNTPPVNYSSTTNTISKEVKVPPTTNQSDKMTSYTNQSYGYTMSYPKNWVMEPETQELRKPNRLLSIVKVAQQDKKRGVSIIVNENEWMMRLEAPKKESITIDGTEQVAYIFPSGYECGGQKGDCSYFVIPMRHGNVWYELHAIGDAKTVTDTYKEILSSFKFTK